MSDLQWTPIKIRLGQIQPWTNNPRMSTKAQAQRLIKSERRLGQIQTLAVGPMVDGMYPLYDGHQRVSAWLTVKTPDFEVLALQSNRPLTEDERREVAVLLHTATGSWNWDALSGWSAADLREWGMDKDTLSGWKSDTKELTELLSSEQVESADAEPQIDRAAELLEKWQVQTGDLWQIGEHRLVCGDCTDAAMVEMVTDGQKVGAVVTDPPYGIGIQSTVSLKSKAGGYYDAMNNSAVYTSYYRQWLELVDNGLIWVFINWRTLPVLIKSVADVGMSHESILIWDKEWIGPGGDKGLRPAYEMATLLCVGNGKVKDRGIPDIFRSKWSSHKPTGHQAEKPVDLMEHLVKMCEGSIFDPFAGSGTTLVACQNLGRKCRAIEISPAYCSVILERMSTAFPQLEIKRL